MKKIVLTVSAIICAVCTGCLKQEKSGYEENNVKGALTINVEGAVQNTSKSSGTALQSDEDRVGSVQIFLFSEDGKIEVQAYSGNSSVTIVSTMGRKTLGVVVNCPEIAGVTRLSELNSKLTLLQDNAPDSFVMYKTQTVDMDAAQKSVDVKVKRLVCKIVVKKISNRMTLEAYRGSPVRIKGIYLINVAGEASMDCSAVPGVWLNRIEKESSTNSLYAEFPSEVSIAYNEDDISGHYFYCYPNPVEEDSSAAQWSARHTRLVIEAEVDGKTCYYPATLPVLEPNKVYIVNDFVLTRVGTDKADEVTATGNMDFSLQIEPWGEEYMDNVTI